MRSSVVQAEKYSARLTGNQFLYNEFKVVCDLLSRGLNKKEAEERITTENLFEYRSLKSIGKHITAVWERANYLDEHLLKMVLELPNEIGRVINLYAILKYDLLFFEFVNEIISEKFYTHQLELTRPDISNFFSVKAEQSDIVAQFKEATLKRLRLAYIEILEGAGYIARNDKMELSIPSAVYQITDYLESIGEKKYSKALLGA